MNQVQRDAWVSQWDPAVDRAGDRACFRACRVICQRLGAPTWDVPEGTVRRFQCAAAPGVPDPTETRLAGEWLRQECSAGRGVIVGIDYKASISQNRDGITDHFVVLCEWHEGMQELRGLNPGALLQTGMDYNVAFAWSETRGAWVRSFPERLQGTVISMVVPSVERGKSLPERP